MIPPPMPNWRRTVVTEFDMWWEGNKEVIMRLNQSPAQQAWDFQQRKLAKCRTDAAEVRHELVALKKYRL